MVTEKRSHTVKFRRRRVLNWLVLGVTYSTMYMGRYNLPLVNPILSELYGWSKLQVGQIISPALLAYGMFAIFNGVIADQLGGRKAILIGSIGASIANLVFGMGAYMGFLGKGHLLLAYFISAWMLNSYFQSFGAVSMVKVNAAWFWFEERGIFSAIFGTVIQAGRALIFTICPLLLLYFEWQWLFFIPSVLIAIMSTVSYFYVRNTPQDCGLTQLNFPDEDAHSLVPKSDKERAGVRYVLVRIFKNPVTLAIACAEFCTGLVRQGFEQWFPRYMVEVQNLPLSSTVFQKNALAIVLAGIGGAIVSGTLSDWVFKGKRTPVAFLGYLIQIISLTVVWLAPSLDAVIAAFIFNSCAISMVHSMLSGTASIDFGGQKAAATAVGLFDGMQYIGGSFVGIGVGWILDRFGWTAWGPSMIGFSFIGAILMLFLWNARPTSV